MNKALKELIIELVLDYADANAKAKDLQGRIDMLEANHSGQYDKVILRKDLEQMFGWAPLPEEDEEKGEE